MRFKKLMALGLVGAMVAGLVGCGSSGSTKKVDKNKLVVWSLADDLKDFGKKYEKDHPGKKVEFVKIAPEDYLKKIGTALDAGEVEPDIIVGEPQMLQNMYDKHYFADLSKLGAGEFDGKIVDYVWQAGQDEKGVQRAISYQITPAGFYYRRDIAKKVFGTEDPEEVGKLFKDYDTILTTAQKLQDAGYKIFASDGELQYFSGNEAWVVNDTLNVAQCRKDYMDLCIKLYQKDYTAFANQWTAPWFQAMSGPVPLLTKETQNGVAEEGDVWDPEKFAEAAKNIKEKTEVFAYGLPAWGVLSMRDNVGDNSGKFGVCSGPAYGFGGGTYIGISELSQKKDFAWDFVKYCTLNEETADWWIETSQGDTVSLISALEKHADDENPIYGGQKLYKFWQEQAAGIDYSKVTKYDDIIGKAWGDAITAIKTEQKDKDTAIADFYKEVKSQYPKLKVEEK